MNLFHSGLLNGRLFQFLAHIIFGHLKCQKIMWARNWYLSRKSLTPPHLCSRASTPCIKSWQPYSIVLYRNRSSIIVQRLDRKLLMSAAPTLGVRGGVCGEGNYTYEKFFWELFLNSSNLKRKRIFIVTKYSNKSRYVFYQLSTKSLNFCCGKAYFFSQDTSCLSKYTNISPARWIVNGQSVIISMAVPLTVTHLTLLMGSVKGVMPNLIFNVRYLRMDDALNCILLDSSAVLQEE